MKNKTGYLFYTAFRAASITQDTKDTQLNEIEISKSISICYIPHLCIQARIPFILTYSSPKEKALRAFFLESQ